MEIPQWPPMALSGCFKLCNNANHRGVLVLCMICTVASRISKLHMQFCHGQTERLRAAPAALHCFSLECFGRMSHLLRARLTSRSAVFHHAYFRGNSPLFVLLHVQQSVFYVFVPIGRFRLATRFPVSVPLIFEQCSFLDFDPLMWATWVS